MPAMTTHSLTGSAAARASGSAGGTTGDASDAAARGATVGGATGRGAAAESVVASYTRRGDGDGGAVAAGAGACARGPVADILGRGEDEEAGDQGDLGFQLSLGRGLWAPKVRLCAVRIQLPY